jgi:hypothetical protein
MAAEPYQRRLAAIMAADIVGYPIGPVLYGSTKHAVRGMIRNFRLEKLGKPSAPVRRGEVADIGDLGIPTGLEHRFRRRQAPPCTHQFQPVAVPPHARGVLVRMDAARLVVSQPVVQAVEQAAQLVLGGAVVVEVAHPVTRPSFCHEPSQSRGCLTSSSSGAAIEPDLPG